MYIILVKTIFTVYVIYLFYTQGTLCYKLNHKSDCTRQFEIREIKKYKYIAKNMCLLNYLVISLSYISLSLNSFMIFILKLITVVFNSSGNTTKWNESP